MHLDICGPLNACTHSKSRYFITFIDDVFRYTIIYLFNFKYEIFDKFKHYKVCGLSIVTSNSLSLITDIENTLAQTFEMTLLNDIHFLLGNQIVRNCVKGLHILLSI